MGMAASQARLLSLQARQSDLEYQGQQINQERTVLSQQVTALYNSLLTMTVPTPPSTNDYTTVQYAGTIGATSYIFDASSVKPCENVDGNQTYYVTVKQSAYGDSLDKNPNIATVSGSNNEYVYVQMESNKILDPSTGTATEENRKFTESEISSLYVCETGFTPSENGDISTDNYTKADKNTHFDYVDGGYVVKSNYVGKLFKFTTGGGYKMKSTDSVQVTIDGHSIYKKEGLQKVYNLTEEQMNAYRTAVNNSGLVKPNGDPYDISEFYMYFNDDGEACFVLQSDADDGNDNAITYKYIANGDYTKNTTYDRCKLTFDPTSGRITAISIPNYKTVEEDVQKVVDGCSVYKDGSGNEHYIKKDTDGNYYEYTQEDGKYTKKGSAVTQDTINGYSKVTEKVEKEVIASYTTMEVAATTITDDVAYEEAYNQYEYAKYQYDQKQQEINAQTEIIQQMDRNLELKLQRLDNEREQITNETEALDKVISENIQSSYKTFSG